MKNVIPLLLFMLLVVCEVHGQPPVPFNLSASNVTSTSFTASWSISALATSSQLDVADNIDFTNPILVAGVTTSFTVTELNPGTTYHFRVRAVNAGGTSENSGTFSVILPLPPVPPAPFNLSASNVTSTSFTASWSISALATSSQIDVADNIDFINPILDNVTVAGAIRNVTELNPGTTYHWRVRAVNAGGTSLNSQRFTVTTMDLPPVVTSFTPSSGPAGTTVTITGANFEPEPGKNIVFFGAAHARAIAGTSTTLSVVVPNGATFEPIRVLNTFTALTGYGATPFNLTFNPAGQPLRGNSFGPRVAFGTGVTSAIKTADFNGDGKPDVLAKVDNITSNGQSKLLIYLNQSLRGNLNADSFAPPIEVAEGFMASDRLLITDDMNGDGRPDIIAAFNRGISIFLNRFPPPGSSLSFRREDLIIDGNSITNSITAIATGDLDSDGKPDLAITNFIPFAPSPRWVVTVFHNDYTHEPLHIFVNPGIPFRVGEGPTSVAIGDLDNDLKSELVIGDVADNTVSVFRNTSVPGFLTPASFAAKIDFAVGEIVSEVVIGDLDTNGKQDLAVGGNRFISVFDNIGTGPFSSGSLAPRVDYDNVTQDPNLVRSLAVTDLNGNGMPELITNGALLENRSIVGSERSTFVQSINYLSDAVTTAHSVAACDLDGDGKPDLVIGSALQSGAPFEISVLHNNLLSDNIPDVFITTPVSGTTRLLPTVDVTAKALAGASTYTIQLSTDENFIAGTVIERVGSRAQRFTGLEWGKRYYGRVKTNLSPAFGKTTDFSLVPVEDLSFVISPADGAIDQSPNLSVACNSVPGATQYTIELNTSPDFTGQSIVKTGARGQSFTGLSYNTTYYSRVRTEFTQNWGQTRSFTVTDASRISFVISPADGATGQPTTLNLVCSEVPGATQFTIRLTTAGADERTFTSTSRSIRVSGLNPNTLYQTQVQTNLSPGFGPPRTFTTAASALAVFPNPASSQVTISNIVHGSEIKIVNALSGKLVATIPAAGEEITIGTASYGQGLYYIIQVSPDGKSESLKLLVD